jgi:hypothetical protein
MKAWCVENLGPPKRIETSIGQAKGSSNGPRITGPMTSLKMETVLMAVLK